MMKMLKKKRKGGFTLIELIVVVAILGILALIAIPRFANLQANAQAGANKSTAASILSAADIYWVENQAEPTGTATGNLVVGEYLKAWPAAQGGTEFVLGGAGAGDYSVTYPVPANADATKYTGTVE